MGEPDEALFVAGTMTFRIRKGTFGVKALPTGLL